ncbi:MAG: hypothetical protein JNJ78_23985 [Anaerolineae bacterium]|nr:hypothetical protein [Anaerolineae bacterium]
MSGIGYLWLFALGYGLLGVINHYIIRWILVSTGAIPSRFIQFLDQAVSFGLLRYVGGGYSFASNELKAHIKENTSPARVQLPASK